MNFFSCIYCHDGLSCKSSHSRSQNKRLLLGINALYGSSTMSNEQEVLHRLLDVVKSKQRFPLQ
ncbi:hypothetical protein GLYMA_19G000600v4 [Glycine max]|uniref:Uncharacterized protein n=1 Tax=Glycine max TaxID=3847 RepID=A0A0R0EG27_SOYBN|nr:hypothetical protein GYH30_051567 [Glycine max]KRG93164.1 hypothetical protein GLYMA_19G000600v4 [Glycine max]